MLSSLQLAQEAKDYKFNTAIPLRIYLKTCIGILDKAQLRFQNGDNSGAFMYYYRYVDLCTNKLSKHPEFLISGKYINGQLNTVCDPDLMLYRQEYLQLIKLEVPAVLKIIEDLKKKIDDDWERHQVSLAKNIAKNRLQPQPTLDYKTLPPSFHEHTFQQSLSFFQGTKLSSRERKTTNNSSSSSTTDNNTINKSEGIQTQTPTEQNNPTSNTLLLYPELPQLSFPTF